MGAGNIISHVTAMTTNHDKHDKHILTAFSEMKMACVFNPPLNGTEVHNNEGAYELEADAITE